MAESWDDSMRLLSAEEFKKEPYGTVYCMYKPQIFLGQLKIKSEPSGDEFGDSWYAVDLMPWAIGNTSEESFKELYRGECNSTYEIKTEAFYTDDAIYNHADHIKFATFNKKEVITVINLLFESLTQLCDFET